MKKFKSILSIIVALSLIISTPIFGLADNSQEKHNNGKNPIKQEKVKEEKVKEDKDNKSNDKGNQGKGQDKSWKETKNLLENEKDILEAQKDELESKKDELENQLNQAKNEGNKELEEQLRAEIQVVEKQRVELKSQMKNTINLMKEITRNKYSLEELEELTRIAEELKKTDENIDVIPVEDINIKNKDIKFDTPPVIKEGRTLIPVRAITEGFGAELQWNSEEKKVTIIKGDVEIILHLDSNIAIVNGEEVELEVPATSFNNRTYVPLRFLIENYGLNINWDKDTGLIEIDEDDETSEEEIKEEATN